VYAGAQAGAKAEGTIDPSTLTVSGEAKAGAKTYAGADYHKPLSKDGKTKLDAYAVGGYGVEAKANAKLSPNGVELGAETTLGPYGEFGAKVGTKDNNVGAGLKYGKAELKLKGTLKPTESKKHMVVDCVASGALGCGGFITSHLTMPNPKKWFSKKAKGLILLQLADDQFYSLLDLEDM